MKNLVIIFVVFIFFESCGLKDKQYETTYLNSEITQKFFFKKNSYWIYRDSISGKEDSFFLYTSSLSSPPAKTYEHGVEQSLLVSLMCINSNASPFFDTLICNINYDALGGVNARSIFSKNKEEINLKNFQLPYFFSKQDIRLSGDDTCILNILPKYVLGSNSFLNVSEIRFGKKSNTHNSSFYYFNDSVGYIKMRINYEDGVNKINQVWELQKWEIFK